VSDLLASVRRPARMAGLMAWTVVMDAAVELRVATARGPHKAVALDRYMRRWTRGLLRMFGVRVTVLPALPPPPRGARLVVSNHRAVTDIPVLLTYFGGSVLSRADLAGWPVLGRAARTAHTIFVERDQKTSRSNAVRVIRERLEAGGTVTVFPEGTVQPGDVLLPFRRGAFAAARDLPVEIVPVGIDYPPEAEWREKTFVAHLSKVAGQPAIDTVLYVGEGMPARGTPEEMGDAVQAEVQRLVQLARAALDDLRQRA